MQAVERVEQCIRQGLEQAASGDIDNFFSSIDRARMLALVRKTVWEQPILDLLETYLHIGATKSGDWVDSGVGIAQGSPLSPVLSNLYLLEFDKFLDRIGAPQSSSGGSRLGVEWVRYADNFRFPDVAR